MTVMPTLLSFALAFAANRYGGLFARKELKGLILDGMCSSAPPVQPGFQGRRARLGEHHWCSRLSPLYTHTIQKAHLGGGLFEWWS